MCRSIGLYRRRRFIKFSRDDACLRIGPDVKVSEKREASSQVCRLPVHTLSSPSIPREHELVVHRLQIFGKSTSLQGLKTWFFLKVSCGAMPNWELNLLCGMVPERSRISLLCMNSVAESQVDRRYDFGTQGIVKFYPRTHFAVDHAIIGSPHDCGCSQIISTTISR